MAYSHKSNIVNIEVCNSIVIIQADKLNRICEMYPRVGNLLEQYRGKQINDELVIDNLTEKLEEKLNNY
jgi:hypothetical protein